MKKSILWAMLAMLLPVTQAWGDVGGGHSKHFGKAQVTTTGNGTVYMSTSSSSKTGDTSTTTSDGKTSYIAWNCNSKESGDSKIFWAWATPNEGYKFAGWLDDASNIQNPRSMTIKATSTTESSPTMTSYTALFVEKVAYSITYKCSGGTYKAGSETINADKTFQKDDNYTVTFSDASPSPGYEFVGWCRWHDNGATEILSYKKTFSMTFTEAIKFGAFFREAVPVNLTIAAPEGGTCTYKVGGGNAVSMTSESDDALVEGYGTVSISFTATPADKSMRAKWYHVSETGIKTYFSYRGTASFDFTASGTIGVDYEQANPLLAAAIEEATTNSTHTAVLASDASVFDGTEVEIPSGVTIDLSNHTLFVDGKLTVNGAVNNGTVSKCGKLLRQYGVGLEPYNPYSTVKYWRTTQETPTADATASATHVTLIDGKGNAYREVYTTEPKVVKCTLGSIGQNMFGAIVSRSDSASITTRPADTEMYVALDDVSLDGPIERESNKYDRLNFYSGKIDLAGKTCTSPASQYSANHKPKIFNGVVSFDPGSYAQNSGGTFYNCSSITIKDIKNCCYLWLYDCETGLTLSNNENGYLAANFYSGKYTYTFGSFTETKDSVLQTKIYGGAFKTKPDDKYLADSSNYAFYQHDDGYWYVEPKQEPYVATVTCGSASAEKVYYLTDAFAKLNTSADVSVTMLRSVTVDAQQTVPAGKKLVIELNGCRITAPNGFVKNSGTVEISDQNERSSGSGVYSSGANVFENETGGSIDICYGEYVGNIVVNGGSFTTHQGTFRGGTVTKNGSADVNLRGGSFDYDVGAAGLMDEGYIATPLRDGGKWWVGVYPWAHVEKNGVGNFTITAMTSAELADYRNGKTSKSQYTSAAAWKSHAEFVSSRAAFVNVEFIDFLIETDCDAEAGTITTKYGKSDEKLYANMPVRFFSPRITGTQISYSRFMYDVEGKYDSISAWASSSTHRGATCTLYAEIWRYKERHSTIMVPLLTIAKESFVFGMASDDKAMIVGSGDVTFKKSLAAAVSDVAEGRTVRLCQSCANESLTVTKPCTIDLNDFAVGTLTAGDGLEKSEETMPSGRKGYVFTAAIKECKLTVTKPDHVTAVTVQVVGGDVLTPEGNVYTVPNGASVTISYTMATGYDQIASVTLNNLTDETKTADMPTVTATKYGIDYELNGGTETTANPTTYTIEDEISLHPLEREGYEFSGWCLDSDLNNVIDGLAITAGTTGAKTFYAMWMAKDVVLTLPAVAHATVAEVVADGEAVEPNGAGKYVVKYGQKVVISYVPEKGYLVSTVTIDSVALEQVVTPPSVSTANYAITYVNGGTSSNPTSYTIESDDITLVDPTLADHTFRGWYEDSTFVWNVKGVAIPAGSTGNKTFYAKWDRNPVQATVTAPANATIVSVKANGVTLHAGADGQYTVPYGAELVITYAPNAGYEMTTPVTTVSSYTGGEIVSPTVGAALTYSISCEDYDGTLPDGVSYPTSYDVTSADITLPTPTKADYVFGGWYEDKAFSKKAGEVTIPSGSTGDKTFYASWVSDETKVISAVEVETTSGETEKIDILVPAQWKENVLSNEATEDEVTTELMKTADNGLKNWQNLVLNNATKAKAKTETQVTVDTSKPSEVDVQVTLNDKVKSVGVAKVATGADGATTIEKKVETTVTDDDGKAKVTVDYSTLEPGVYQPTIVVESEGKMVEIPDPTADKIRVVKNEKKETLTVLDVPFSAAIGGQSVSVASVIDTSTLTEGDSIKVYNTATGNFDAWDFNGTQWEPVPTYSTDSDPTTPVAASELKLTPGQAIILERSEESAVKPITMVGQKTDETFEKPMRQPESTDADPVWNLVPVSQDKSFDLNAIAAPNENDQVVVPSGDNSVPKIYTRKDDSAWTYTTNVVRTVTIGGKDRKVSSPVVVTNSMVEAGRWFWYVSGGGQQDTKIEWKDESDKKAK